MMKIIVSSQSKIKIRAVENACRAFNIAAEVQGVDALSRVPGQPVTNAIKDETLIGAYNRLAHARELAPDADLYVSIESGLYKEKDGYLDKAVILMRTAAGTEIAGMSDAVSFPLECVEDALAQQAEKPEITAGMVMQARGIVTNHADPHLSLTGKPRSAYLEEALLKGFSRLYGPANHCKNGNKPLSNSP